MRLSQRRSYGPVSLPTDRLCLSGWLRREAGAAVRKDRRVREIVTRFPPKHQLGRRPRSAFC